MFEGLAGDGAVDLDGQVEVDDSELPPAFIFKLQNIPHREVQVVDSHPLQLENPLRQRGKHFQHRTYTFLLQHEILPLQQLQLELFVPLSARGYNGLAGIKVVRSNVAQTFAIF